MAYRDVDYSNYGMAMIGAVSGTSINYGSEYVFNAGAAGYSSLVALSSTRFVVAYRDYGNSYYGTARIGDVSGTNINFGSKQVFNAADTADISAAALSSARFFVVYQDVDNSDYGTVVIGDVSSSNISYGSEYVFNPAPSYHISAAALSPTHFVMAYRDVGPTSYGTAVVGSTSGNTVGIAGESKTAGQTVPVIIGGVSDAHSGLTPGETYYGDAAGGLTTYEKDRRIGLAISDTELLLDMDIY